MIARAEIDRLSIDERLQLVEALWNSIVEAPESLPVSAEDKQELARRVEEHRRNPASATPWDAVKAKVFQKP